MKFTEKSVTTQLEILKRKLGGDWTSCLAHAFCECGIIKFDFLEQLAA